MELTVGTGRLTWDRRERVIDRYGYVYLLASGDSLSPSEDAPLTIPNELIGKTATLKATVLETRQSTHIGDLTRGVFPTMPQVGEVISLGTGRFVVGLNANGTHTVGLAPEDMRADNWLDINALYRAHEQTVRLDLDTA